MAATTERDQHDESVKDSFARLYNDGRAYASAEIERQKLRAGIAATGMRDAAIFGAIGGALAFASLVACLVGLILTLAPRIGPGRATLAVVGASLLLSLLLFMMAKMRLSRMKKDVG